MKRVQQRTSISLLRTSTINTNGISLALLLVATMMMVDQCRSFSVNHFVVVPKHNTVKRRRRQQHHQQNNSQCLSFLHGQKSSNSHPSQNSNSSGALHKNNRPKQPSQKQQQGKGYQQIGGPIASDICTLSKDEILQLIRQRTKERRKQNFRNADSILLELKQHLVFVNDATKEWRADGQSFVYYDEPPQQSSQQQKSHQNQQNPNYNENSNSAAKENIYQH